MEGSERGLIRLPYTTVHVEVRSRTLRVYLSATYLYLVFISFSFTPISGGHATIRRRSLIYLRLGFGFFSPTIVPRRRQGSKLQRSLFETFFVGTSLIRYISSPAIHFPSLSPLPSSSLSYSSYILTSSRVKQMAQGEPAFLHTKSKANFICEYVLSSSIYGLELLVTTRKRRVGQREFYSFLQSNCAGSEEARRMNSGSGCR